MERPIHNMGVFDFLFGKKEPEAKGVKIKEEKPETPKMPSGDFLVMNAFEIHGVGIMLVGNIKEGHIRIGFETECGLGKTGTIYAIEINHQRRELAKSGEQVSINIKGPNLKKQDFKQGQVLHFSKQT